MKWLVQTLDGLANHASNANLEQKRLEELITRYKRLIPTIEMTIVRTELYSKCYTYSKEVNEVCELLERVGLSGLPHIERGDSVAQLVKAQESAVTQLDSQRPNIMSMLQRGRDLAKDTAAPPFLKETVSRLETHWNHAYNTTLEKLNTLKATQKVWQSYCSQKSEILCLLERAEKELSKVSKPTGCQQALTELEKKQELNVALRKATENILLRLRDLCMQLAVVIPDVNPILLSEVPIIFDEMFNIIFLI
ncbi:hypothetical protein AAG570_006443 [Ranatra chinensis]|uniref:Uncharacterized protein n=1 Tax=Ranatra chinensis TaxID=642074 RepID=A0ABD0YW58_9HEMI